MSQASLLHALTVNRERDNLRKQAQPSVTREEGIHLTATELFPLAIGRCNLVPPSASLAHSQATDEDLTWNVGSDTIPLFSHKRNLGKKGCAVPQMADFQGFGLPSPADDV